MLQTDLEEAPMIQGRLAKHLPILIVSFLVLAESFCGGTIYVLRSRAPDHEIVIDGKADDWQGALSFVDKEQLFIGIMNDRKSLYVCLVAAERGGSQALMRQGLTVWFDPSGGKDKVLGIKYPIGRSPENRLRAKPEAEQKEIPEPAIETSRDQLEILRPNEALPEKKTLEEIRSQGIEVKIEPSSVSFVYELKIPLLASEGQSVALGASPGSQIGIGFETGDVIGQRGQGTDQGEMGGGAGQPLGGLSGGMGGRGGRMGGGRGGGMSREMPKPIKIWANVQLAAGENVGRSLLMTLPDHRTGDHHQ
jgi:hypothetical protein